jgi:hypothetical protein
MTSESKATAVPPVEVVLSEAVANLAFAAHAYLSPREDNPSEPADLESASLVLDVAGFVFERIEPRLPAQERSAIARLLTDLRLTYVKRRG